MAPILFKFRTMITITSTNNIHHKLEWYSVLLIQVKTSLLRLVTARTQPFTPPSSPEPVLQHDTALGAASYLTSKSHIFRINIVCTFLFGAGLLFRNNSTKKQTEWMNKTNTISGGTKRHLYISIGNSHWSLTNNNL